MDSKLIKRKAFPKTLLLKDYLLDDMSSCSSNGFNSFPRKQCCTTTVRFLIEIDLKNMKQPKKYFIFNNTKHKFPISSAFQTLVAAVKRLPHSAARCSPEKNTLKKIIMKSVFWKKKSSSFHDIGRWKSLHQMMKESSDSESMDIPNSCNSSSELNLSSFTEVKRNDDGDNDNVELIKDGEVLGYSAGAGATRSSTKLQRQWPVNGEKEQFSPVSVLDCPFEDDDELSSPFPQMEGTDKKLMEKMKRFECLSQLNLSKRFALLSDSDNESARSPSPHHSSVTLFSISEEEEDETRLAEKAAPDLLQKLMDSLPSNKAEKVVFDFFKEKIMERNLSDDKHWYLEVAERWMNGGRTGEAEFVGWEVQSKREAYLKEMERSGEWRCLEKEIGEIGLELEAVVFDALFHELVVDVFSTTNTLSS